MLQVVRAAIVWQRECALLQCAPWEGRDELYYLSQAELGTFCSKVSWVSSLTGRLKAQERFTSNMQALSKQ